MFVINILVIAFLVTISIICFLKAKKDQFNYDKKAHKLYFLFPLAERILVRIKLERWIKQSERKQEMMKVLYSGLKKEEISKIYWYDRISTVVAIVILFNILSIMSQLAGSNSELVRGEYILRPDPGKGGKRVELNVTMEKGNKGHSSQGSEMPKTKDVSITVQEQAYSTKEKEQLFADAYVYLQNCILGENKSFDKIYTNLNLVSSIPKKGVTVEWRPSDYSLIQTDGQIHNDKINAEGKEVKVTSVLSLQDERREYNWEFKVMPRKYTEEQLVEMGLVEKVKNYAKDTIGDDYLRLPNEIEGYRLNWKDKSKGDTINWLFLGVIASVIAWLITDKELENNMKKRKDQMEIDYPEIINKFTLLVNAGMTVKQAWNKIIEDYKEKYGIKSHQKRFAYEEMITTMNELKLGVAEQVAYEQFGRRVGSIRYIKFSSLINQNLKKGTKGFTDLLMKEAEDAFELRKQNAKRLGEEAGTKLLMPMMMLLVLVFLIIMIPAFWSFRG